MTILCTMGRKARIKKLRRYHELTKINEPRNQDEAESFWQKVLLYLSLGSLFFIIRPFLKDGVFSGHDIAIHLIYLNQFKQAILEGQLPVRVISWITPGLDQPLFNFYQPGFFYLAAFLGIDRESKLMLLMLMTWLASGLFMYLFVRCYFKRTASLASAMLYLFAPYHILDLFVRAALPEFTALMIIPLLFWVTKAYFATGKVLYFILIPLSLALLIITHPPLLIIFFPLYLTFIGITLLQKFQIKTLVFIITGIMLGIGNAAFFLLPAMLERKYIQSVFLATGYFDFRTHFVCLNQLTSAKWGYGLSISGCMDEISFQLGIVHWIILGVTLLTMIYRIYRKKYKLNSSIDRSDIMPAVFLVYFFFSLFMTLNLSSPVWEIYPLFPLIQYPWRFLAAMIFSISFLAGWLISLIRKANLQISAYFLLLFLIYLFYRGFLQPAIYLKGQMSAINAKKPEDFIQEVRDITPELGYHTIWAELLPEVNEIPENEIAILSGKAKIEYSDRTAQQKIYNVNVSSSMSKVRFYTHFYPGWKIYVNNKPTGYSYNNIYGYMELTLNSGENIITLKFTDTAIRLFANLVSVISLIITLLMGAISLLINKNQNSKVKIDCVILNAYLPTGRK